MGDFPAAEVAQEKLMGLLFDHESEGPDEEQMREVNTLSRLFNLFHARVQLVGSASQTWAKLSIVYRAAILDLEELNIALFEQGLIVLNRSDQWSCSSLHIAAKKKAPNLAGLLLEKGADINLKNDSGETPLHIAVKKEAKEIVLILLNYGVDTEIRDKKGQTALHAALSGWKNEEILALLIEKKVDIEARDSLGRTPLHNAITRNLQTIARFLIKYGADVNAPWDIVSRSCGLIPIESTMLFDAATQRKEWAVKMLLDAGADLQKGNTGRLALYNALADGQDSIAKLLLDHGAELQNATASLGSSAWSFLLDRAIDKPNVKIVEMILKAGGDLNMQDSFGDTALHQLMRSGRQRLERKVSLFVDHGAQVSIGNSVADTPLHLAVHHGRPKIVQMLLDAGAEAQCINMLGETPLDMARDRSINSLDLQEKETWSTLARHMQRLPEAKCSTDLRNSLNSGDAYHS